MATMLSSAESFCAHGTFRTGRYAAIDIGTVTCRMLIADIDKAGVLHEVRREYAITNLGEDVDATGVLKPQAMRRVADVIARYQHILSQNQPADGRGINVMAVATSAARDAKNATEFTSLLADLGVALTVVPGEREAALSFSGASCGFAGEDIIVVDVGGGSTEIVMGHAGSNPLYAHSFNIGCRRVTEKFLHADPPSESEISQARTWITEGMSSYFDDMRARGFAPQRIVAVAGTATTVVSVYEQMKVYDSARVHKAVVTRSMLDHVYDQLAEVSLEQRERIVGLDPGRAPVIVAGMIILQIVLDLARIHEFTVSESDILHGIVLQTALN